MNYLDKRYQRVREIFEEERDDVLACRIIRKGEHVEASCGECDSYAICRKVFEEESEGGG